MVRFLPITLQASLVYPAVRQARIARSGLSGYATLLPLPFNPAPAESSSTMLGKAHGKKSMMASPGLTTVGASAKGIVRRRTQIIETHFISTHMAATRVDVPSSE